MSILQTLLGLNRTGKILYTAVFVLAVPAMMWWFVWRPGTNFHDEDERLFRAARHGDVAAAEQSLTEGARVDAAAPVDGKTALFRAAVFGHADVVRVLLEHGADINARGNDGHTVLEVIAAARQQETDPARAQGLDAVAAALHEAEQP